MTTTIGSFRDATNYRELLPAELQDLLFGKFGSDKLAFDLNPKHANLNHAAFGAAFSICSKLAEKLHALAEEDPGVFYDKLINCLLKDSLNEVQSLMDSKRVFFTPNLTIGIKALLESLFSRSNGKKETVAILEPIYGATRKLVMEFLPNKRFTNIECIQIQPGIFVENVDIIIQSLDEAFKNQPFQYLIADHVTSQTGRILPLNEVIDWCKGNNVILIVDGTQSMELKLEKWPSYYILSTHKWLCNIKTCGIIRVEGEYPTPDPCGISFGYGVDDSSAHLWTGMQDYIPHIVLGLAVRIYKEHGSQIRKKCSELLERELKRCGFESVFQTTDSENKKYRMYTLVKVNRFDHLAYGRVQDAFDNRNLRVSFKEFDNQQYLRISVFDYNTERDFNILSNVINYNLNYQTLTKEKLIHEFLITSYLYDSLFEPLTEPAYFVRAEPLRHHLIFYYGHTSVFYVNKLVLRGYLQNSERIDKLVESSCAVGVDEMSWDDLNEDNYPWTEKSQKEIFVSKIRDYRQKLRDLVCHLINNYDFSKSSGCFTQFDFPWIILMGIEHERIHIETSACIIHQLQCDGINKDLISPQFSLCPHRRNNLDSVPSNSLIYVDGGDVQLGRSDSEHPKHFGWDNEFGSESAKLQPFRVSQMLVSNGEYFEFIQDGGYKNKQFWTEESWKWVTGTKRERPLSWVNNSTLRTLYEEIPMPWDWPVETNAFEADAFCVWKSKQLGTKCRLISHEEWSLLRNRLSSKNYNTNLRHWGSACPVDLFGENINSDVIYDIAGNVWQHSCSVLTLLQRGFKTHPAYDDFTTPTIDGNHMFILGGSWISVGNPTHLEARYGFRKHFQQFAGIRYVVSGNSYHSKIQPYYMGRGDSVPITDHYLDFKEKSMLGIQPEVNWYRTFGKFAATFVKEDMKNLDIITINGSVGRTTLEFIKACSNPAEQLSHIFHTDLSATHLRVLENLISCDTIRWDKFTEGDLVENHYFNLEENDLLFPKSIQISYRQVDTNNIDPKFCNQDIAIVDGDVENFKSIDKLNSSLVKPGGILILATLKKVERIPGYENTSNSKSTWKITRDTSRKHRVVRIFLSSWKRNDILSKDLPLPSEDKLSTNGNSSCVYYQQPSVIDSYEKYHFGEGYLGVPNFSKATAEFSIQVCKDYNITLDSAIDIGCGPGRTSIELCSIFKNVTAIDLNKPFIDLCDKNSKFFTFPEGHRLNTIVGDALDLVPENKTFNLVVAINLIDRLENPGAFITGIKPLVSSDGILIISSPFTWLEEFTPKANWLGGYQKWAETHTSIDGLKEALGPEFEFIKATDIPFVIPDSDGSFQYTLSNTSVFRRVDITRC